MITEGGGDNLYKTLKAYRTILGLSQTDMANIADMCLTSYNQKEQGKKQFTHNEMLKITDFIKTKIPEVTVDQIFFNNEVSKMITI